VDGDIIPRDGDAVFVASLARGSDLDRLISGRLEVNGPAPSSRKKEKKKDRCLRSHDAPEGIAGSRCCKGEMAALNTPVVIAGRWRAGEAAPPRNTLASP
jgi:hypothetical protein